MAGGGSFTAYDKEGIGVYTQSMVINNQMVENTNGVVALTLPLDWGKDNDVISFDQNEFESNAIKLTGYPKNDIHNLALREVFRNAREVLMVKLNSAGSKAAKHETVGTAACTGIAGNDIKVTVYKNVNNEGWYDVETYFKEERVDKQTVKGKEGTVIPLPPSPTATISEDDSNYKVKFENLPAEKQGEVKVEKGVGGVQVKGVTIDGSSPEFTVKFDDTVETGKYTIKAMLEQQELASIDVLVKKTTTQVEKNFTPKAQIEGSDKDYTITFSGDYEGYTEKVEVVKDTLEPNDGNITVGGSGKNQTVKFEEGCNPGDYIIQASVTKESETYTLATKAVNIPKPLEPEKPSATITAADKVYTIVFANRGEASTSAELVKQDGGAVDGNEGNTKFEVSGSDDNFTVTIKALEAGNYKINAKADSQVVASVNVTLTEKEVQVEKPFTPKAEITGSDQSYNVTFSGQYDGYTEKVVVLDTSFQETSENVSIGEANPFTVTFTQAQEQKTYLIEAQLTKSNEVLTIATKSVTITAAAGDDHDFEGPEMFIRLAQPIAVETEGADCSELVDNDYVIFNKDGVIPENVSYVFSGGESQTSITGGDYSNALNILSGYTFNTLVCDSTDETVKAVFVAQTQRSREGQGHYYQTVMFRDQVDYEGVISVYNNTLSSNDETVGKINEASAVYWYAGASAAVPLSQDLTNVEYTGELVIDGNINNDRLSQLEREGYVAFTKVSPTQINVNTDVNTLVTYNENKTRDYRNNQVVRILDYIHNEESTRLNQTALGKVHNNEVGRSYIFGVCKEVLEGLAQEGVIDNFNASEAITVDPIPGYSDRVLITQRINTSLTIRQIYIKTICEIVE